MGEGQGVSGISPLPPRPRYGSGSGEAPEAYLVMTVVEPTAAPVGPSIAAMLDNAIRATTVTPLQPVADGRDW